MVAETIADEVAEFRTAVAGLEIDWVRTDQGSGQARTVSGGNHQAALSYGGLDFSTLLHADVPDDLVVFQLVTRAPDGQSWCGSEARTHDLRVYRPGMSVFGKVPAGSRAVTLVAGLQPLDEVAEHLGLGELQLPSGAEAQPSTPEVDMLVYDLISAAREPEHLETSVGATLLLESAARAIASVGGRGRQVAGRGFDSSTIVALCLSYVDATVNHQPTISELCRVGCASESRLRQAFVEILGVPPIQYFQLRVLSMLRDELVTADPNGSTVTRAITSLGLTQLGRVAGRYRSLFGETPRETLHRRRRVDSRTR